MRLSRRRALVLGLAAPALLRAGRATAATVPKISHQFPGGTATEGDFRDRLCRRFAKLVSKRSKGALTAEIYPSSSLMKTNAQFSAMRKGALDMSLIPISYAGGDLPELAAMQDDVRVAKVYEAAGATVYDLDDRSVQAWRALARDTAWKDYANKSENGARLIKLAMEVGS